MTIAFRINGDFKVILYPDVVDEAQLLLTFDYMVSKYSVGNQSSVIDIRDAYTEERLRFTCLSPQTWVIKVFLMLDVLTAPAKWQGDVVGEDSGRSGPIIHSGVRNRGMQFQKQRIIIFKLRFSFGLTPWHLAPFLLKYF